MTPTRRTTAHLALTKHRLGALFIILVACIVALAINAGPASSQTEPVTSHEGILHWGGVWTGNDFWCDAGYQLNYYHYDCGCSNNASWITCNKTCVANAGSTCTSAANSCGMTATSYISCDGVCQAVTPSDALCAPQCSDGIDNDGDGTIDFGPDLGCMSTTDTDEAPNPPAVPSSLSSVCSVPTLTVNLDWNDVSSTFGYYLRVSRPASSSCPSGWMVLGSNPNICVPNPDLVNTSNYSGYPVILNTAYTWSVHSRASDGEWSQAANGSFTCTGSSDLTAGSITPTSAVAGTSVTLSGSVSNTGNASTGVGFSNQFQRATSSGGASATTIGTYTRSSTLVNGSNFNATLSYTFPSAQTWYVRVCADQNSAGTGAIAESNEGNNCGAWTAVSVSAPTPTANLTANPTSVITGNASTLSWSSTNAASCTGTGFSTGGATSGSVSTGPVTTNSNYQVTCGSANDTASVTVIAPTADISVAPDRVNAGDSTLVSWTTALCTDVSVTKNGAVFSTNPSGTNVSSGAISGQTTFALTCDGGAATDSVIVNIVPKFEEF